MPSWKYAKEPEKKEPFITQSEITDLEWWLSWKRLVPLVLITALPYVAYRLGWL